MIYSWNKIKPPYGSLLKRDHPLLRSLEYCFLFSDNKGSRFCKQPSNAPRRRQYLTTGDFPNNISNGQYLKVTTNNLSTVTNYSPFGNQYQSTEIVLFKGFNLSTFTNNKVTFRNGYLGIVKCYGRTTIGVRWESMSGSEFNIGSWPSNKFLAVGASYYTRDVGGVKTGNIWGYYNGAQALVSGDRTHDRVAGSLNWSTNSLLMGAAGDMYAYFRWNRILSPAEHAWMAEQPWDVFSWPTRPVTYYIMPPSISYMAYSREYLSASDAGNQITLGESSPGVLIHTATGATLSYDEIWLWAANNNLTDEFLTVEWGGTGAGNELGTTLNSLYGYKSVIPGLILNNNAELRAYASTGSGVAVNGYVNRIDPVYEE